MAHGHHQGKGLNHPEFRALFTRENMLAGDWYGERLAANRLSISICGSKTFAVWKSC